MSDLSGRVVRGWLSRMAPGPWSGEQDKDEDGCRDIVTVADADGAAVADVWLTPTSTRENAGPIAALPEVLRAYLTVSGELLAVERALAAAGVDEGGVAGVEALHDQVSDQLRETRRLQADFDAQGVHWDHTRDQLDDAERRLLGVRSLLRELTGRLMARVPAAEPEDSDDRAAHRYDELDDDSTDETEEGSG